MSKIPRTQEQRRRLAEFWACLVIFGGSLFMMGWLVGGATAAPCKAQKEDPNVCVQAPSLDQVLRTYRLGPRAVAQ